MTTISKTSLFRSLRYEPHAGQQLIHDSTAKRRVVACGSRWGKTYCAAMEGVAAALEPGERTIGWVVAPTYDLAKRVYGRIQAHIAQHLAHRIVKMNDRERWFVIRNMSGGLSEVRAKTADNPVSLLGEGLDWLIVDEAARLPRDIWENYLSQRLLDKGGSALLISTPRGVGWFYDLYKLGQKNRDPDTESWSSPTWANPHMNRERIERERMRLPGAAFDEEYGAVFLGAEDDPCETCGCPSLDAPGLLIADSSDVIPVCEECGQYTDEAGRTLVKKTPGWRNHLNLILLTPNPGAVPELPFDLAGFQRRGASLVEPDDLDWDD